MYAYERGICFRDQTPWEEKSERTLIVDCCVGNMLSIRVGVRETMIEGHILPISCAIRETLIEGRCLKGDPLETRLHLLHFHEKTNVVV